MSEPTSDRDCSSVERVEAMHGPRHGPSHAAGDGTGFGAPPEQAVRSLRLLVEERIIPQLVEASDASLRHKPAGPRRRRAVKASDWLVDELARLAIANDAGLAGAFVAALVERGMPLETAYLELLAPAARRLGAWWTDDRCSFVDVTVGLWRLQQIIQRLVGGDAELGEPPDEGRRLLLVPEPGEQHTFGLIMLAGFFRRDGWCVFEGPLESRLQIESLVAREEFAVVGLSIGCESRLGALATTVRRIRAVSRNPAVGVMVGGAPFLGHPERVQHVGADCTAANAQKAVAEANRLRASQVSLRQ